MTAPCRHLDLIADVDEPLDGCTTCLAIGAEWMHLRQCLHCGITLCCDSSPNRHMSAHQRAEGHAIMRSAEPEEDWAWCYIDEISLRPAEDGGYVSFDPFLETGTWVAGDWLADGDPLPASQGFVTAEGVPLGQWVGYARERHEAGELDAAERAAIEALPGWSWSVDAASDAP
jgi:hypothetical protein